jgi:hypothetical protein
MGGGTNGTYAHTYGEHSKYVVGNGMLDERKGECHVKRVDRELSEVW